MKTVTTTREYDDEGRMVKETVIETSYPDVLPHANACNCLSYGSGYCPVHGYRWQQQPVVWCDSITATTTGTGFTINAADVPSSSLRLVS